MTPVEIQQRKAQLLSELVQLTSLEPIPVPNIPLPPVQVETDIEPIINLPVELPVTKTRKPSKPRTKSLLKSKTIMGAVVMVMGMLITHLEPILGFNGELQTLFAQIQGGTVSVGFVLIVVGRLFANTKIRLPHANRD